MTKYDLARRNIKLVIIKVYITAKKFQFSFTVPRYKLDKKTAKRPTDG
jgi:hypothetical protein